MTLGARIAWRYLISKKSHSAVGAISLVSLCGIAVATAAIICVLSVFNGFRTVIAGRLDTLSPDVMVTPAKGKVFENADSVAFAISRVKGVLNAVPSVYDNALAVCDGHEMPVNLKGVDISRYREITSIDSLVIDSRKQTGISEPAVFSIGVANRLASPPGKDVMLFAPVRTGRINTANPSASFLTDSVIVDAVFRSDQSEFDENLVIVDINSARDLFQYDTEASAIEVQIEKGYGNDRIISDIENAVGPGYVVKDRIRQQAMNFRMISIEKWVTFLLLFFILVIASFNLVSSISMLVLEKQKSMSVFAALGLSSKRIGNIFFWESIYVSAIGGGAGIILGVALSLLQQHFGFIRLNGDPGTLTITDYPVKVIPADILITIMPVAAIGITTAFIVSSFARSRIRITA